MDESKTELEEIFDEKFMTSAKFSMDIENLVKQSKHQINYIDAIVHYCNENDIDVESVSKLISKPLKEKVRLDAVKLNFIKKTSKGVLPI
jgi:Phage late-transcription coactivator